MNSEEYRRTSLENWQTMASGWERRRADIEKFTRPVTEWLVRAIEPQPGDTVLELAKNATELGLGRGDDRLRPYVSRIPGAGR